MRRPVIAVVGPTAAGKSQLSLRLAIALDGEVINADSMQLYRGMDVGTAKLTPGERAGVPHHLLDVWDVTTPASVSEYQRLARAAIADVHGRGKTPVLVGGSGLYVRAAIDSLEFPGTDPQLRARLEAELDRTGSAALHGRLAERDPAAAAAILPGNGRRIVRALEVIELSGRPFTAQLPRYESVYDTVQLGVEVPRPELDQRIAARVARMWELGLVEEVRTLEHAGLRRGRTARAALGYAQVLRFLDGEWTAAQAIERTVTATRRLVRRQESWFRRDPRVRWLDAAAPDLPGRALAAAVTALPAGRPLGHRSTPAGLLPSGHAVRQGPWHRKRLRGPARPGWQPRPDAPACRPALRAAYRPGRRRRAPDGARVGGGRAAQRRPACHLVHGLPQRRRQHRGDVRQRGPGLRPVPAGPRPGGRAGHHDRDPCRAPAGAAGRRRPAHR